MERKLATLIFDPGTLLEYLGLDMEADVRDISLERDGQMYMTVWHESFPALVRTAQPQFTRLESLEDSIYNGIRYVPPQTTSEPAISIGFVANPITDSRTGEPIHDRDSGPRLRATVEEYVTHENGVRESVYWRVEEDHSGAIEVFLRGRSSLYLPPSDDRVAQLFTEQFRHSPEQQVRLVVAFARPHLLPGHGTGEVTTVVFDNDAPLRSYENGNLVRRAVRPVATSDPIQVGPREDRSRPIELNIETELIGAEPENRMHIDYGRPEQEFGFIRMPYTLDERPQEQWYVSRYQNGVWRVFRDFVMVFEAHAETLGYLRMPNGEDPNGPAQIAEALWENLASQITEVEVAERTLREDARQRIADAADPEHELNRRIFEEAGLVPAEAATGVSLNSAELQEALEAAGVDTQRAMEGDEAN